MSPSNALMPTAPFKGVRNSWLITDKNAARLRAEDKARSVMTANCSLRSANSARSAATDSRSTLEGIACTSVTARPEPGNSLLVAMSLSASASPAVSPLGTRALRELRCAVLASCHNSAAMPRLVKAITARTAGSHTGQSDKAPLLGTSTTNCQLGSLRFPAAAASRILTRDTRYCTPANFSDSGTSGNAAAPAAIGGNADKAAALAAIPLFALREAINRDKEPLPSEVTTRSPELLASNVPAPSVR